VTWLLSYKTLILADLAYFLGKSAIYLR